MATITAARRRYVRRPAAAAPPPGGCHGLALATVALTSFATLAGCEAGELPHELPAAAAELDVAVAAPVLQVSAGARLAVGHPFSYTVAVGALPATDERPLGLELRLHAPSRQAECVLARASLTSPLAATAAGAAGQERVTQGTATVPKACKALVGAHDLQAMARLVAKAPAAAGAAAPGPLRRDSATSSCLAGPADDCLALRLDASPGVDLQVSDVALPTSVAVLEYAGKPLPTKAAAPAIGVPGEAGFIPAKAAVDPAAFAPTLATGPLLQGSVALKRYGELGAGGAAFAAADLALSLAIRPKGMEAPWAPALHAAVAVAGGAPAPAALRSLPLPSGAEATGGDGVSVPWALALPEALRQRLTVGDWRDAALLEVRVCVETAAAEAGLAADAKANDCQTAEFVLIRVERPYGVHRFPAPNPGGADLATSDYFEIGKTESQGSELLRVDRFRGGYRAVTDGHVRFGGVFWTQAVSSIFSFSTDKFTTIRAYHDTAPMAQDFVSGSIDLLGFPTIPLPKYDVPDTFQFALDAAVDTSNSSMKFGGTANLAPLVSALNFVGKQASSGGPKFCVPLPGALPDICLEAPLLGSLNLMVGVAFAKGVETPKCTKVAGVGCLEVDPDQAGHFWANAKSCVDRGASLPSNRGQAATVAATRAFANALGAPFYLGGYRFGIDYNYFMSQVFFEKGWGTYATEVSGALPTWWAFLDASLLVEQGACAVQAPDSYTKAMRVEYGVESVAKAAVANPALLLLASNAHVPCHAQLQRVCEYPIDDKGVVQFERNEIFAQLAVQAVLDVSIKKSVSFGVSGVGNAWGEVSVVGNLLSTTFAATVGQAWTATRRANGAWETKGSARGTVGVTGKLGEVNVSGKACGELLWVIEECFGISLGGLFKLLPLDEVGVYFAMDFLPFHVKSGG